MKALIATACVCVIAATGYYFASEYQAHSVAVAKQAAEASRIEAVRQELFKMAEAKPGETEKVKAMCKTLDQMITNGAEVTKNDIARQFNRNCRALGYLS